MFSIFETSRKSGRPVELYLFRYGPGAASYFAYTNAERAISFNDLSFVPISIARDSFTVSGTLDRQDLNIDVPHTSEVPELVRLNPPTVTVSLQIYQGHSDDPDLDFQIIWAGRVTAVARKNTTATMTCQSLSTSLRRQGLRRNWQYGCPHVLYGPACRADKASATLALTILELDSDNLFVYFPPNSLPLDMSQLAGGTLEFTTLGGDPYSLTIVQAANGPGENWVKVAQGVPASLTAGLPVNIVNGCDHSLDGCALHHNADNPLTNVQNYGGQPWIPTKNPVGQYNAFY